MDGGRLLAPGIVDQDVQSAQALHRLLHHLLAEGLVAQIAGDCQSHPAFRLDQRNDFARVGFLVGKVVDRHIGALARESDGGSAAHAGITSGDQCFPALQASRPSIAFFAVIGPRLHLGCEPRPGL